MTENGQIGGSIVVSDDGNAGETARLWGFPGTPPSVIRLGNVRMGWAQANEISWSNRAQKSPVSL